MAFKEYDRFDGVDFFVRFTFGFVFGLFFGLFIMFGHRRGSEGWIARYLHDNPHIVVALMLISGIVCGLLSWWHGDRFWDRN